MPEEKKNNQKDILKGAPPLVRSSFNIDLDKEIPSIQDLAGRVSILKKSGPYIVGFISFVFGLIFFLPLDDLLVESINQIDQQGGSIQFDYVDISTWGELNIRNLVYTIPLDSTNDQNEENIFTSILVDGDLSLIRFLLFDTLVARVNIKNFHLNLIPGLLLSLKGEMIKVIFEGEIIKNNINSSKGKLQINTSDILGNYDGVVPFAGEKLGGFVISNIIGEMDLKPGILFIKDLQIESTLANVSVTGTWGLSSPNRTNLSFTIDPQGLLQKYSENNIEPLLKGQGLLHDDGRLLYECRGGFLKCDFKRVSKISKP